jgi:enamine deaminase RidA (YjgF/YER057c/UK114 family)
MVVYSIAARRGPSVALDLPIYGVPNAQDAPNLAPSGSFHHIAIWAVVSVNQKEADMKGILAASLVLLVLSNPASTQMPAGAEARLKALNITLPPDAAPAANFVNSVQTGKLLFLSGNTAGPAWVGKGKLGKDLTVEQGREAARQAGLIMLTKIRTALGSLDRVKRVVKVLGMVNSAEGFGDQPLVVNGFSDLMVEVFGEAGKHARSAVGMAGLPGNSPIEVEMIVEFE